MTYLFSTLEERDDRIIAELAAREAEVESYETSLAVMAAELDSKEYKKIKEDWPARLLPLRGKRVNTESVEALSPEDAALMNRLQIRDEIKSQMRHTEKQLEISRGRFEAQKGALPPDRLDAGIARYMEKRAAK